MSENKAPCHVIISQEPPVRITKAHAQVMFGSQINVEEGEVIEITITRTFFVVNPEDYNDPSSPVSPDDGDPGYEEDLPSLTGCLADFI